MLPSQKYSPSTGPRAATPSPPPRLKYFISRSNGKIVPLIPADELPYKVRLFEVPRVMRMEQTEGMTHVGMHPTTGQCFKLESDVLHSPADATILERRTMDAPKQLSIAPNARPSTPNRGDISPRQQPASASATTWRRGDDTPSPNPSIAVNNAVTPDSPSRVHTPQTTLKIDRTPTSSPSSSSSEPGDKVYCTHWIRHGECDYIQQGCRYKHEMPDKATLASIGFRTVPRWWQEKTAVKLGQSALPTVGPVMKPSEWMQTRRSSVGSLSDHGSGGGSDSESKPQPGALEDPVPVTGKRRKILKPRTRIVPNAAPKEGGSFAVLQPSKNQCSLTNINTQVSAVPKTTAGGEPSQPHSPGSDLIDLDPVSPKIAAPRTTRVTTDHDRDNTPQLPLTELHPVEPSSKQPTKPTRKVFVPAGESTDFHIADARKHAQTQENPERRNQRPKTTHKQKAKTNNNTERRSSIAPQPLVIRKHADVKTGLLASKHAPRPDTANISKHADVKTGLSASKHAPPQPDTASIPNRADVQTGLLASKHASRPDSAKEAGSSRAADTSSKAKPKAQTSRAKSKARNRNRSPEATRHGRKKASTDLGRFNRAAYRMYMAETAGLSAASEYTPAQNEGPLVHEVD